VEAAMAAARSAHPYEEPIVLVVEGSLERGCARMGRVCAAPSGATLGSVAGLVAGKLGVRATAWGDAHSEVRRIGVAPGSGRSLVADAIRCGCDTLVTGELRYHEALDAVSSGLTIIEGGHDATEWPLTRALARIAAATPGLDASHVLVDEPETNWWTAEGA
jgi:putative NIF3 family GTP cyclohydrolase 1 type 2